MFCTHCGTEMADDLATCPQCGQSTGRGAGALPVYPGSENTLGGARQLSATKAYRIDPDLNVALTGWWQRVGSTIIDLLILSAFSIFLNFVVRNFATHVMVQYVAQFGYMVLLWTSVRAQTVGNRAVGTKVVAAKDAGHVTINRAIARWAAQQGPYLVALIICWGRVVDFQNWGSSIQGVSNPQIPSYITHDLLVIGLVFGITSIYGLIDYLMPLWDRRNRTLHDRIAGTLVVQAV